MKALVVEDEDSWREEIKAALLKAVPSLKQNDVRATDDPELALQLLEDDNNWQYRLVLLDWGFVRINSVATAKDVADHIYTKRKDIFVIILTGGAKDERMVAADGVIDSLVGAKLESQEKIFKYNISKSLRSPEKGLPGLVKKLQAMGIDEKLRKIESFNFSNDFQSCSVGGIPYTFNYRQVPMLKLLFNRFQNGPTPWVSKVDLAEEVRNIDKNNIVIEEDTKTGVKKCRTWDPNDEFKKGSSKAFWQDHVLLGDQKGVYRLVVNKPKKVNDNRRDTPLKHSRKNP